jgi:hypothetical protein
MSIVSGNLVKPHEVVSWISTLLSRSILRPHAGDKISRPFGSVSACRPAPELETPPSWMHTSDTIR